MKVNENKKVFLIDMENIERGITITDKKTINEIKNQDKYLPYTNLYQIEQKKKFKIMQGKKPYWNKGKIKYK